MKLFFPDTEQRYDPSKDAEAMEVDKDVDYKKPWGPPSFGIFVTIYEGRLPRGGT